MKRNVLYRLCISVFVCISVLPSLVLPAYDYASVMNQKLQLEESLALRTKRVVSEITGTDKVVVVINITPNLDSSEIERETWIPEGTAEEILGEEISRGSEEFALPGVPIKKELGKKEEKPAPTPARVRRQYEKVVRLPDEFITKIIVRIIIDSSVPEELVTAARQAVIDILGVNPARGDILTVQRQAFPVEETSFWQGIMTGAAHLDVSWIILIILLIVLFFALQGFLKNLVKVYRERRAEPAKKEGAQEIQPVSVAFPPGTPGKSDVRIVGFGGKEEKEAGGEEGEEGEKAKPKKVPEGEGEVENVPLKEKLFNFIREENLPRLIHLLSEEPPEVAALVTTYLDPRLANEILSKFPPEKQSEIAFQVARIHVMSPERVKELEGHIRASLESLVGGEDYLVGILDQSDDATREKILESVKARDPELAKRLKDAIFSFSDIAGLDDTGLALALRDVNVRDLACALRGASELLRAKITSSLSAGAQALLTEEIQFARPVPQYKVEETQRKIVGVLRRLEREGKVILKAGAHAEAAAAGTGSRPKGRTEDAGTLAGGVAGGTVAGKAGGRPVRNRVRRLIIILVSTAAVAAGAYYVYITYIIH